MEKFPKGMSFRLFKRSWRSTRRVCGGLKYTLRPAAAFSPEKRTAVHRQLQRIASPVAACCIRHRSALHFNRQIIAQNVLP